MRWEMGDGGGQRSRGCVRELAAGRAESAEGADKALVGDADADGFREMKGMWQKGVGEQPLDVGV